jgi:M6 family metalloprotease-like protein
MPTVVYQPDGSPLDCFASGDEFHNWLHDADQFTIIRDPKSGEYRYAEPDGESVKAGKLLAGRDNPRSAGLKPGINISPALYKEARKTKFQMPEDRGAPTTGTFNNLVIYIRFSDEGEYGENISLYNGWFNTNASSLKNYFLETSYNQLTVNTTFYPTPASGYVVSWQDSHPRAYFQPYDAVSNPTGYQDDNQSRDREFTLLQNASTAISSMVPADLNIDANNDGRVDNVVFIVKGSAGAWSSLLWPHRWSLYDRYVYIRGKRVYDFNFQLQNFLASQNVGVICHEFYHSLGAPDLYHYTNNGISPAGSWDLMNSNTNPPQHMTTYMKMKYGGWVSSIPTISANTEYSLNPVTSATGQAYRINSTVAGQYYVLEYRRKTGTFENSIPGSGIIIYRIDTSCSGNADGPPDELYVYRPGGTLTQDGSVNNANFSLETGRTAINNNTNPSPFLQNGSAGNLEIFNIGSATGATITFSKGSPEPVIWDFSTPTYQESFDSAAMPDGWSTAPISGSHSFEIVQSGSSPTCSPAHGSRMLRYNSYSATNGSSAFLVSPILRIDNAEQYSHKLKMSMYRDGGYLTNADRIEVWLGRDPQLTNNPALAGTINRSSSLAPAVSANAWYEYEFTLPIDNPGDYYLVLKAISAYGNNIFVDNLRLSRILDLPLVEAFDQVLPPQVPALFSTVVNSSSTSAYVKTIATTNAYSAPNALELYNANDLAGELLLLGPVLPTSLNTISTKFRAKASSNGQILLVGSYSPATGAFTTMQSITLSTAISEYEVSFLPYPGNDLQIAFKHGLGTTYRRIYLDDITIGQILARDLRIVGLDAPQTALINEANPFSITVHSSGLNAMQNYLLQILDADTDAVLTGQTISTALQPGQQAIHVLNYTFSSAGTRNVYAKVSHPQDMDAQNNSGQAKSITIFPPGVQGLRIGAGFSDNYVNNIPFNFYYKNNVAESIYYPGEGIFTGSTLHAISYDYNFVTALTQTPIKVWLKNTDTADLSAGWLSPEGYQLVFDGMADIPAGTGTLLIPLDQAFLFEGPYLSIRTNRPMDASYYSSSDTFCAHGNPAYPNRSRVLQSDSTTYDPLNVGTTPGTLTNLAPKLNVFLVPSDLPFVNLSAQSLTAPAAAFISEEFALQLSVANSGNTDVESFSVQILSSEDNSILSTVQISQTLAAGETDTYSIPLTLQEPGEYNLHASLIVADETEIGDNSTLSAQILILGQTVDFAQIGHDQPISTVNTVPFNFFYKNSVAESIYLAEELNLPQTLLYGIHYSYSFVDSLVARPIKVWLKNTTESSLITEFPAFADYVLVFDDVVDFRPGERILYLPFSAPFIYTGGNLAIRSNRVMDQAYYSSSDHFKIYTAGANRSIFLRSDSIVYDPTAALTGATATNTVPLITFHYLDLVLAAPELRIEHSPEGIRLDWQAVDYANKYLVYISDDLETWSLIETTENWYLHAGADKAFFKVVADTEASAD